MDFYTDIDWEEAYEYQPGFTVELKSKPGMLDTIASYDPMMVPPIWLVNDPRPRYPHEVRVVLKSTLPGNESSLQSTRIEQFEAYYF